MEIAHFGLVTVAGKLPQTVIVRPYKKLKHVLLVSQSKVHNKRFAVSS